MAVLSSAFHVPLGTPLFDFTLPDLEGDLVGLQQLRGNGCLLILWSANHCPYVRHIEGVLGEMLAEYTDTLRVVAISSNDVEQYPDDDIDGLRSQQSRANWEFPYLVDADQSAAKAFNAACTPDFFLYDAAGRLVYRGAFDASTPKNGEPLTGDLLRDAIEATINDRTLDGPQRPAMGCGIKWKPGNEPTFR